VELIEVQSGPYLGEDDIVRFEDRYGRSDAPSDVSSGALSAQAG
jgi:mannose-1-phosphate guanylyltransferase